MPYERAFSVSVKESIAIERIIKYYETIGYSQTFDVNPGLKFTRGKSNFSSDYKKLYSQVKINTNWENDILAVTVSYDSVSVLEGNYIDIYFVQEIDNLQIAVCNNEFRQVEFKDHSRKQIKALSKWFFKALTKDIIGVIIFYFIIFFPLFKMAENIYKDKDIAISLAFVASLIVVIIGSVIYRVLIKRQKKKVKS